MDNSLSILNQTQRALVTLFNQNHNFYVRDCFWSLYLSATVLWIMLYGRTFLYCIKNFFVQTDVMKLYEAVYSNNTGQALELCQSFPNAVNVAVNNDKYTPFLIACFKGNTELVKLMLRLGADIKTKTARKENAFLLAALNLLDNPYSKDASCIRTLFYAGVDINEPNIDGLNALHLAIMAKHVGLIDWLLEKRAKMNIYPNPVRFAEICGCDADIVNLIRTSGGNNQ